MSVLTKEQILAAPDTVIERVSVSDWGGDVCVRTLTGVERDRMEKLVVDSNGVVSGLKARLCAWSMCDEAGSAIFTEREVQALNEKSGVALDRVWKAVRKINGLMEEDVKELEKNSEAALSGDSGFDSPPSGDAP